MIQSYTLDTDIYPIDIILQAIEDFSELADMSIDKNTLSISADTPTEIAEIFHEYMNYCIWLINQ